MGKRGPRRRFGQPRSFRLDAETIEALAQDLAVLRAVQPRATTSDVFRSWARSSDRGRFVTHEARLQVELAALQTALREARDRAQAAEDLVAGYRDKSANDQAVAVDVAVRSLDSNPDMVRHVQDLVKLEAAGLVAKSSFPLLQRARSGVTSWQELLSKRNGMHK